MMPLITPSRLEPMRIVAFHSDDRGDGSPVFTEVDSFDVQYDPDSYSRKYTNVFEGASSIGINISLPSSRYAYSLASRLSFTIILDATEGSGGLSNILPTASLGSLGGEASEGISGLVDRFMAVCYDYDGEIHQPRFLRVEWGTLSAPCRLQSVDIQYSMFGRDGTPIRAKLDCVFVGDLSEEIRVRQEDRRSPDLAKLHEVIAGDNLPLISQKAYGSSSYYLALAKYNQLNHFRELKAGDLIRIPSLETLLQKQE